jgi:uncharacterized protein involved in tolerance to divalent cations
MEGPFSAKVGPVNGNSILLQLVEAGLKQRVRYQADVSADVLVESVLAAAAQALTECRSRGWWSNDANELTDATSALLQATAKTVN